MRKLLVLLAAGWVVCLTLIGAILAPTSAGNPAQTVLAAAVVTNAQEGRAPKCGPTGAGAAVAVAAARWAGFPTGDLVTAVAVAKAESGWVPTASHVNTNGSTDYGLWQINSIHAAILAKGDWRDPYDNAAMAYTVWADAGGSWTPWAAFNSGSYVEYLGEARGAVAGSASAQCNHPAGGLPGTAGAHTQADLIALGRALTARGVRVGEGPPPFGPIHRVHASNSYHYRIGELGVEGMALDINWNGPGSERTVFDALAVELVASGWRVIWQTQGHYDHIHLDTGPAGRVWL